MLPLFFCPLPLRVGAEKNFGPSGLKIFVHKSGGGMGGGVEGAPLDPPLSCLFIYFFFNYNT